MSKRTGLAATLGIVALIVMGIACSSEVATKPESGTGMAMEQGESGIAATALQTSGSSSGIWVTGQASVTVEPDLVLLTIGVETTAETVAGARAEAAGAMGSILQSVRAQGLEERDVQTQSFNIWPQYEYPEVTSGETRTRQQILVGYTVSNTAIIRIRDVDAVGTIIDGVAEAGGDATRIDGISFSIEDQKPFMDQLREDAVQDATAKAEHLAGLAGVEVGDLVFISEVGAGMPVARSLAEDAFMSMASFDAPTPVSGGELQLSLNVQAAFSIH